MQIFASIGEAVPEKTLFNIFLNKLAAMSANMDANTQALINDARARRGETRQMGQCLQADKMATPRAGTYELGGECNGCQARGGGG